MRTSSPTDPGKGGAGFWLSCLLAAVCLGVYGNSIHNDFLQDDVYNITQNTFIREPSRLPKLFTRDYFRLAQEGAYRPLPTAVLFADHALFGDKPEGYRAVNLGWHLLAVLLLFWLLTRFLGPSLGRERARTAAFLAALLFAVHPVHSQMISVISYHEDLICFVFMLACLHLYLSGRLGLSLAAFLLALFSKEMAVTLPAVLVLYHLLLDPASGAWRARLRPRRGALAAFFALSGLFVLGRFTLFKPSGIMMESNAAAIAHWPGALEFLSNALAALVTYARYLGLLIWPGNLSVDWDSILAHHPASPALLLLSLLLIAGMLWAAWRSARRTPWITFGLLYFLGTLLPVSGVIPFWSSMAERYLYIPSLGIFLVAGCVLEKLHRAALDSRVRSGLALALLAPAAMLAWRTVVRNRDYKDESTLYIKESAVHPRSYGAWYGRGYALGRQGDYVGAKEAFLKADALESYHKIHFMLAFVEEKLKGPPDIIEKEYKRAIDLEGEYYPAHFNLAVFYHRQGRFKEAIPHYEEALRINPSYREAAANLGAAYLSEGRFKTAARELSRAAKISPELDTPLTRGLEAKIEHNLAAALFNLDNNEQALAHYRKAVALNPALEKKPIVKAVKPVNAPVQGRVEDKPLLAELKKLYPRLAAKWAKAGSLEYDRTPEGYQPRTGSQESPQTQENLKPEEKAALEAMTLRDHAPPSLRIALPAAASDKLTLELGGIRLEQTMLGARAVPARTGAGLVAYPGSYPKTEVFFIADARQVEQLFFLRAPQAPIRFAGKVHVSSGSLRVEENGELALHGLSGERKLTLSRPVILDAQGTQRQGDWVLDASATEASGYVLTLAFDPAGLAYPLLVDPTWTTAGAGSMGTGRESHTATLLPNGKVLVAGGRDTNAVFLSSAELYDPLTGTWSTTGSLATARERHTATLLPNGKVLIAGGNNAGAQLTSELYDPAAGVWSASGSLATARYSPTATLLPNGKVLVAGGVGAATLLTAELYDPSAGIWSATGSLATARNYHTATLLPSGKVLVAGGVGAAYFSTAELYDPLAGTWSAAVSMNSSRTNHSATLLPNGKVLVAGGRNSGGPSLTSAELYDPSGGTWSPTGPLAGARESHAAVLLPNGNVLVAAGTNNTVGFIASAELYDSEAGTWSAAGSLANARSDHSATLLPNGKVLVEGGRNAPTSILASAELYDPTAGNWSATGSLATARYEHTLMPLPNGKVLAAAGYGTGALATAELYTPSAGTWSATGSLATARYSHAASQLADGKVLVVGGYNGGPLATAELYDSGFGTWSPTGSLATARHALSATLLRDSKVLVAGGAGGPPIATAELYDPGSGTWTPTGSLANARSSHNATLLPNGKVLAAGGYDGTTYVSTAELYDPAAGTWSPTGSLATGRYSSTATLLPNGKVLIAGGDTGTAVLLTAELYDPAAGTWSPTGSMATARTGHAATLLPSGKVLVMGGGGNIPTSELYDPAAGLWSAAGSLATGREAHFATLLPNGKVLVAGGNNGAALATSELALYTEYDYHLSTVTSAQPVISTVRGSASFPVTVSTGAWVSVTGSTFTGASQGSGGGYNDSSANTPRVYLRALDTGRYAGMSVSSRLLDVSTSVYNNSWSESSLFILVPKDVRPGHYYFWVQSNAVPSEFKILKVQGLPLAPGPVQRRMFFFD